MRRWLLFVAMLAVTACVMPPGHRTATSAGGRRLTFEPPSGPVRFLVVGDTQNPRPERDQHHAQRQRIFARLAAALADSLPVFHVGDMVAKGGEPAHWQTYFDAPFWDSLTPVQRGRFFPVPGNHEYKSHWYTYGGDDLRQYHARFGHLHGRLYYYFTWRQAAFVCLNSGRNGVVKLLFGERWQNGSGRQRRWLEEVALPDLRARAAAGALSHVFVFFHKPGYATPVQITNEESVDVLRRFDAAFAGLERPLPVIAFVGHIHTFAHMRHDYDGRGAGWVDQVTVGLGGGKQRGAKYFRHIDRPRDLDLYRRAEYAAGVAAGVGEPALFDSVRVDSTHFGFVEVVVRDTAEVRYHRYRPDAGTFELDYVFRR